MNEEEPKDWEREEENPPENLKRKWVEREYFGRETSQCRACKKFVPSENLTCLFCGSALHFDSGVLGKILRWLKSLF